MNNRAIKKRAEGMLLKSKDILQRTMLIMLAISLLDNIFSTDIDSGFPLIALIITIIFLPFSHGYVVMSLKAVRNREDEITTDDAFTGFRRFKELFFTYFLKELFVALVVLVFVIIGAIVLSPYISQLTNLLNAAVAGDVDSLLNTYIWENLSGVFSIIAILCILAIIAAVIVGLMLFATPYLLERYDLRGMDAIKESVSFMKGHKGELFSLEMSFLGWMFLEILISGTVAALFTEGSVVGSLLAAFVAGVFAIYIYLPKYYLSLAIFFEEIAYQKYGDEQDYVNEEDDTIDSGNQFDENQVIDVEVEVKDSSTNNNGEREADNDE